MVIQHDTCLMSFLYHVEFCQCFIPNDLDPFPKREDDGTTYIPDFWWLLKLKTAGCMTHCQKN